MQTDVRVVEARAYFSREHARTPMKFGGVVMDATWYCHVGVTVENRQGIRATGWGATLLADLWAWPSPITPHETSEAWMCDLVTAWCRQVETFGDMGHPVDMYWQWEPELFRLAAEMAHKANLAEPVPRLAVLMCAAPLDAAIHDAFGQAANIDTYDGYGPEYMQHDLSRWLGSRFKNRYISNYLRKAPQRIDAFHLVGGLDKLTPAEVTDDDPQDELPVSLDAWIRREKLRCLKVKLCGNDLSWDFERLLNVTKIAREEHRQLSIDELWLTLDTNEMCDSPQYAEELLLRLQEADPRAFDSVLYLEQPCERDLEERRLDVRSIAAIKPVIIDEAMASLEDLELSQELGYSGVALKACKCQSAELVIAARAIEDGISISIQDLACPGIALLQSARLGAHLPTIHGVETNGRQFYPRTSDPERAIHPGIFCLNDGQLDLSSISGNGLGYRWEEIGRVFP